MYVQYSKLIHDSALVNILNIYWEIQKLNSELYFFVKNASLKNALWRKVSIKQ